MLGQALVAIAILTLAALFPVALIWYINSGGIYAAITRRKRVKLLEKALPNLTCSINADCPPGFACLEGRCVAQEP